MRREAAPRLALMAVAPALAVVLAGCPGDPSRTDSGVVESDGSAGGIEVTLGTGFMDWHDLVDGQRAEMVRGPQGGQHIWTSIRARDLNPMGVTLHMRVYILGDLDGGTIPEIGADAGPMPDEGGRADLRLTFDPYMADWYQVQNLTLFITRPEDVNGRRCRVEVFLQDRDGKTGLARRDVDVFWAAMQPRGDRDAGVDAGMDAGVADAGSRALDAASSD